MANDKDVRTRQQLDDPLSVLQPAASFAPDLAHAWTKVRERCNARIRRTRGLWIGSATAALALLMLPWPRAVAQQVWRQLLLGRVEVIQVTQKDLPANITAALAMEPQPFERESVKDLGDAERLLGFRPSLPPAGLLGGEPRLSVVKRVTLTTRPLRKADIERALGAAGVSDVEVPREWEGTTLVAEAGPVFVAEYDDAEIMQLAPFRMSTPAGFDFGRFMEVTFRVFGRSASEAKILGEKFKANPALVMHFPEHEPVRDVVVSSGQGVIVGDPEGPGGICFFWNAEDRIYILSAENMSEQKAVTLANSVR